MKNRDFMLMLIVLAVGLFIWQLLQKVNIGLATVSQTDKTGADLLTTSTAALQSQVDTIKQAITAPAPFDYASAYQSYKQ